MTTFTNTADADFVTRYGRRSHEKRRVAASSGFNVFLTGVYHYMAMALMLSASVAFLSSQSTDFINFVYVIHADGSFSPSNGLFAVICMPVGLALLLTQFIYSMKLGLARCMFWLFSASMGLALSCIFVLCMNEDLSQVFLITSFMFLLMSYYGISTTRDLTHFHGLLLSSLAGLAIAIAVNLLFLNTMLHVMLCIFGILLFCALISYETQEMRKEYETLTDETSINKAVLLNAVVFYMHFVNFYMILLALVTGKK